MEFLKRGYPHGFQKRSSQGIELTSHHEESLHTLPLQYFACNSRFVDARGELRQGLYRSYSLYTTAYGHKGCDLPWGTSDSMGPIGL